MSDLDDLSDPGDMGDLSDLCNLCDLRFRLLSCGFSPTVETVLVS